MSTPLQEHLRVIAGIIFTLVDDIRSSRILENPIFAELRQARYSHPQRQARRAPTAEWQGEEWREEDHIVIDTEDEIREQEIEELLAAQAPRATRENVEGFHSVSVQTDEAGIHASEEIPRRRLYETPKRCATVPQMKPKKQTGEAGIHASAEIPRRRLYETPERCATVPQMKTKKQTDDAGIHTSEEIPHRRLYETPERCAAVLQMKTKEEGVSATKSNNEGKKVSVVHLHFGSTRRCSRCSNT
jgi:hypothetical protein